MERHDADCKSRSLAALEGCLAALRSPIDVNAYITVDQEGAIAAAKRSVSGALSGFVFAVKDNIHVQGMPSTAGTAALRNFVPEASSPVVDAIEQAGAIILGKAGMHELAYGITSDNGVFGPVRNPLDTSLIAGGSSGGSAAAVASGQATAALGTDTGGSVRLPAAHTGLVGFRPTVGRYPSAGTLRISNTRDTIGLITRSVDDATAIDAAIIDRRDALPEIPMAEIRLGVPRSHFFEDLDREVAAVAEKFIESISAAGVTLVEADLSDVPELNAQVGFPVVLFETAQLVPAYLEANVPEITIDHLIAQIGSPDVSGLMAMAMSGEITEEVYRKARWKLRPQLQDAYARYFARHRVDAVVFPTSPILPRPIENIAEGVLVNGRKLETFPTYIRNTDPASNAGIPAITIPAGLSSGGIPIGMEIDGRSGDDLRLLQVARAIELSMKDNASTQT